MDEPTELSDSEVNALLAAAQPSWKSITEPIPLTETSSGSESPSQIYDPSQQPSGGSVDSVTNYEEFTFVNNGGILETWAIPGAVHVAFP